MAIIKSGASSDQLTVDPVSKAGRVTLYRPDGSEVFPAAAAVTTWAYVAAGTFSIFTTPTDVIELTGSGGKVIRVKKLFVTSNSTAAGSNQQTLLRRSSPNTGGTPAAATPLVKTDSLAPTPTLGLRTFSVYPSGLGTFVGNVNVKRVASPVLVPASYAGIAADPCHEFLSGQDQVLRGVNELLCLNLGGTGLTGQLGTFQIVWTEE